MRLALVPDINAARIGRSGRCRIHKSPQRRYEKQKAGYTTLRRGFDGHCSPFQLRSPF